MLARKSMFLFLVALFNYGLGFITLVIIARLMGPEPLGMLGIATGYLMFYIFIADAGLGAAHNKWLPDSTMDDGTCIGTYIFLKTILLALFTICVVGSILVLEYFNSFPYSDTQKTVIYLTLVATVLFHLSKFFRISFVALQKPAKAKTAEVTQKVLLDTSQIIIAFLGLGVLFLAGAYIWSNLAMLVVLLFMFRGFPIKRPNKKYIRKYLKFGLPLFAVITLADIARGIDKILISIYGSTEDVGFYEAGAKFAILISMLRLSVANIIFPQISYHHSKGNLKRLQAISINTERYLTIIATPIIIFILLFAEPLTILVLGDRFRPAAPIIMILSLFYYIRLISLPYIVQLSASGYVKLIGKLGLLIISLNIILNFIFIPTDLFGIPLFGLKATGAALATLISASTGIALDRYYAFKLNGAKSYRRIGYPLLSGTGAGFLVYTLYYYSSLKAFYYLPFFILLLVGFYLAFLILLKEFKRKDFHLFLSILNPKEMKNYVLDELSEEYTEKK